MKFASMSLCVFTAIVLARQDPKPPSPMTLEPVIGILGTPLTSAEEPCVTIAHRQGMVETTSVSCFTSFYVKWLESSGARAVILPFNANASTIDLLLERVNGVLFTGGGLDLTFNTTYVQSAKYIYDAVRRINDGGVWFPLHGTCMGMQLLSILTANNESVLTQNAFDAENISLPLDFTTQGVAQSRLFSQAPADLLHAFQTTNITENLHHDGVLPDTFYQTPALTAFYNLISTNVDRRGLAFVSTIEAKGYPITATQWHPERPQFEHKPGMGLNHSNTAMKAMQFVGDFFVEDAQRNNQSFADRPDLFKAFTTYALTPVIEGDVSWGYAGYLFDYTTHY